MFTPSTDYVLGSVPPILNLDHPDVYLDALAVAFCYGDDSVYERSDLLRAYRIQPGHRDGVYGALSAVTGRGWLIGFDEAGFYPGRGEAAQPLAGFAVAGLDACLERQDTLAAAISLLGREPQPLWNRDYQAPFGAGAQTGLLDGAERVDRQTLKSYVVDYLANHRRPLLTLLDLPQVPVAEFALLTGYQAGGDVLLGRSPYLPPAEGSGPDGYFRLEDWDEHLLAVVGISQEVDTELTPQRLGHLAQENALRLSEAHGYGTRHYGLTAYDAWEKALLDDKADTDDDQVVARKLQHHSITAGFVACQKAFCVLPEFEAPAMGVIVGLARRAAAGPLLIHGLMWDAWQVVGGYWRGRHPDGDEHRLEWTGAPELERFRDPAVRARAAAVVRRARDVDARSLADLADAKDEWDRCRGHGSDYRCPCWSQPCLRV